ncbi:hypothetical protein SDC9_76924 [bioreactor metagenome]|uniref:Ig-like domain-containing protein n=1 Tax=bioreactor metagenome TaxID=1076179 RepID=A0A644YPE2_9ZZZZ
MTFAEATAIAGTSSQSSYNRFGDYSQTSLDPDGLTFWHTGQYCSSASGQETRIYSFQLPAGTPTDVSNFNATAVSTSQIDLTWTLNSNSNPVMVAWNTTNSFGTPANGTAYTAGNTIAGGGTVLYYGTANNFSHTGLTPATTYYYKIWSNTGSYTWTTGVTDNATTFSSGNTSYPFTLDFESSADYTTSFSPWTTYDGDAQATYQSSDATFTGEGTAFAYLCMNPSLSGWTAAQGDAAHGGSRCGMAVCPADASQSNDWFISPAMSLGTGSSFSLWVLSPKPSTWGNDSYQIMISTTDNQPASFTALSSLVEAPATWTQHTYSLSAYDNQTIYLAIRHVSTDMFMFWMDDLQFNSTISSSNAATIVSNPSSSSVCTGGSVTFTVSATGDAPITYQWQKNSTNIPGATNSSYTIAAVAAGDVGAYRCIVTNAAGADTSTVANLTLSTAPSITTNPVSATQCAGTNVTFTAAASGTATLTYQWKKDGSVIAGATNASYTISSITAGNAGSYTCVVTNSCGSATTTAAVLTVTPATAITTHPVSLNAYDSDDVTLTVVAVGSGLSYQWRKDGINLSDGGNISGSTTATLQITNVSPSDYGTYTCVVTGSCGSATSNGAVLTILTGVEDLEALRPDIYPNPSNGDFTIDLGQTPASGNYYVYDLDGKLLLWRMYKDATQIVIDLSGRAQGTYLIRIDVNDKTFFDRLILKN